MDLQISGKRALVSGSTKGIGFAIACELAREGARVVINGRQPQAVADAVERLRSLVADAEVTGVAADLSDTAGIATDRKSVV